MVVGRKAIIEYLRPRLRLPSGPDAAWIKILRWRKKYGLDKLFHHDVTGAPYIYPAQIRDWHEAQEKAKNVPI